MPKTFVTLAALGALTATAATAAAESYDATQPPKQSAGYLGVGASLGAQRSVQLGMYVDGGKRVGGLPLFVHGQLTGGSSGTDGSFTQLRVGLEARGCVLRELLCGFGGVDAGYQRDHVIDHGFLGEDSMEISAHDAIAVPRVGFELGNKIRLRSSLEMPLFQRLDASQSEYETRHGAGIAATLAVAGVF